MTNNTQIATAPSQNNVLASQQQQKQQQSTPQQTTALLLIDPHSNRFELVQLDYSTSTSVDDMDTTNHAAIIMKQIPRIATNELFRSSHVKFVGILGGSSNVRVALPHGMSKRACMRWARSILTTDPVRSMVRACVHVWRGEDCLFFFVHVRLTRFIRSFFLYLLFIFLNQQS